ncbi:hypothetical protein, partial [Streptomyces sp. NPDC002545]
MKIHLAPTVTASPDGFQFYCPLAGQPCSWPRIAPGCRTTALLDLFGVAETGFHQPSDPLSPALDGSRPSAWRLTSQVTRPAELRFFPGQRTRPFLTLRD